MRNNFFHILLTTILAISLLLLTDPFMLWMPSAVLVGLLFIVSVLILIWAAFIMREKVQDERELIIRMNAGRVAYLAGIMVLTVALVTEGVKYKFDPWITLTLIVMIVVKLVSSLYFERYR